MEKDKPEEAVEATEESQTTSGRQRTISEGAPQPESKKFCKEPESSSCSTPVQVPSSGSLPAACNVPPSPPKFVSLTEVARAAAGLQNMALAHEIAVNADFSLPEPQAPPKDNSLEARVQEMMQKAFWDVLTTQLAEDPPVFDQAINLLAEVKQMLLDLTPPQARTLRTDIEQRLDLDLAQQQATAGTINFSDYAKYVIGMMTKMCCPARDDDVQALSSLSEVVPVFKGILDVLKKMKLDYANFALREARPLIMANSISYEQKKFSEFIASQQEQGIDGFALTRDWLLKHKEEVLRKRQGDGSSEGTTLNSQELRSLVLSKAFIEVLNWPADKLLPETLTMDRERLGKLGVRTLQLEVMASILMLTLSVVGANLRDLDSFKQKLKRNILTLLPSFGENCTDESLAERLPGIALQVQKEVDDALKELELPSLSDDIKQILAKQVEAAALVTHPVRQLANRRLREFLGEVASSYHGRSLQLPAGFSVLSRELQELAAQLGNLVWYNISVFGNHYAQILDIN